MPVFACSVGDDAYREQVVDRQPLHRSGTRLNILTTIPPLYSFTKNIAGDLADVKNLLPTGAGPHEYSFSPADVKKISEAHVIIKNGVGLEAWLDRSIASAGRKGLLIVDTSSGVRIIDNNPHIWVSPANAIIQVKNIEKALIKADPRNREAYERNADSYISRIMILDRELQKEAETWKKKEFVSFHSAFLYFANRYGLKQAAVIQESPDREPTPKHIADVINTIKALGIRAIFTELGVSNRIVRSIANDLDLQVYSLDTMEVGELSPGFYEDRTRANLATLKKALKHP